MEAVRKRVQVNIPFTMLRDKYLERFIQEGLNPEIGFDAEALDGFEDSHMKAVAGRLRAEGLTITFHAPFVDLSPGSPDERIREVTRMRLEQVLQRVRIFRPGTVVCHTGYEERRYWYIQETWIEKSLETWSWLAERLREAGSALMLENVYEKRPEEMQVLFDELRGLGVGFCLDTGHQAAFGKVPLEYWLKTLGKFLGELHLHDNSGEWDEHLALGRGSVDFPLLFERLAEMGKEDIWITLEPHSEDDLLPSLDYLKRLWG